MRRLRDAVVETTPTAHGPCVIRLATNLRAAFYASGIVASPCQVLVVFDNSFTAQHGPCFSSSYLPLLTSDQPSSPFSRRTAICIRDARLQRLSLRGREVKTDDGPQHGSNAATKYKAAPTFPQRLRSASLICLSNYSGTARCLGPDLRSGCTHPQQPQRMSRKACLSPPSSLGRSSWPPFLTLARVSSFESMYSLPGKQSFHNRRPLDAADT